MTYIKSQIKPILIALVVLVALAVATVVAAAVLPSDAQASGVTVHNNYSSGLNASVTRSNGTQTVASRGETVDCGTYCMVYVPEGWDAAYGVGGTSAIGKRTATGWWKFSNSLWIKFVR